MTALLDLGYDANWSGPGEAPIGDAFRTDFEPTTSPEDVAYEEGRRKMLAEMLQAGMDPCATYQGGVNKGWTAYEVARDRSETETVELFEAGGADCSEAVASD